MADRLSYSEFRNEFLLAIAIIVKADTNKSINPLDAASSVDGIFQPSWPASAMKELSDTGLISGMTYISGDGSYRITGRGLAVAEEYSGSIGADLYEMIEDIARNESQSQGYVIGDPDAGYVISDPDAGYIIGEPSDTRNVDRLKADVLVRLNILEALIKDSNHSMIGHNRSPEPIDDFSFSDSERGELLAEIASLRQQIEVDAPDVRALSKGASVFWRIAGRVAGWLGDRLNAQIDNAITIALPTFTAIAFGQQVVDALHHAAGSVLEWINALPMPF